jgi:lambda family phage portal protein
MLDTQERIDQLLDPTPASPADTTRDGQEEAPAGVAVPAGADPNMIAGDAHEGASRMDKQLALWSPQRGSADDAIIGEKDTLDARVHDQSRNDAYIAGGASIHRDNIVGSQFLLNAKPETKILFGKEDEVWEREFQEEVEAKFTLWAESPDAWCDASRQNTLTEMVRLAVGVFTASGEVLATAEWMRDDGRAFRTAAQMLEVDRLSDPEDRILPNGYLENRQRVRGGIERDKFGAPVAYYIRKAHPTDYLNPDHNRWRRVSRYKPWGRPLVCHIFEQTRAEQTRGVSSMVSALKEMRMTKNFRDIVLQNAVVNATYAASIESDMPPDAAFASLGGSDDVPDAAATWMKAISDYAGGAKNLTLGGVKIPHLFPGTKLQLRPAGNGGPLGSEFESSLLRYIAASLGVSYEQLSRDYTKTNYSSARAAMTETWKFMQARKHLVADRYASWVYRLWFEEAVNNNQIEALKFSKAPRFYEGLNREAYMACEWIGAGRGQIDELKETKAAIDRIDAGLSTKEVEIAKLHGGDWRKIARQRRREKDLEETLGISTDGPKEDQVVEPETEEEASNA